MNNELKLNNTVEVTVSMEPTSEIDTSSIFDCQVDHTLVPECDCAICKNDLLFPALPFITIKATLKRKIRKDLIEHIKEQRALKKKKKSIAITARYGALIDYKCGRFPHAFEKFKKNLKRPNPASCIKSTKSKNKNQKMVKQKLKLLGM